MNQDVGSNGSKVPSVPEISLALAMLNAPDFIRFHPSKFRTISELQTYLEGLTVSGDRLTQVIDFRHRLAGRLPLRFNRILGTPGPKGMVSIYVRPHYTVSWTKFVHICALYGWSFSEVVCKIVESWTDAECDKLKSTGFEL